MERRQLADTSASSPLVFASSTLWRQAIAPFHFQAAFGFSG
nr:hypothetical protein [uncultured Kingella sp.]